MTSPKSWLANAKFATRQLHAGNAVGTTQACATPIYQTTSYIFKSSEEAAALFAMEKKGYSYSRTANPTTAVLEARITALEGGVDTLVTSSGTSAILYAILNFANSGDNIVSLNTLYGGTYTLFYERMPAQFGITTTFIAPDDYAGLHAAINDKTRALFFESIGNPEINIPDIEKLVEIAHHYDLPVVVDNTFGTPYLIQLKSYGVDVIVHSLTKYIGGHGIAIGGSITDMGQINFSDHPRFPQFNRPDSACGQKSYVEISEHPYIVRARTLFMRDTGANISPTNAFLILQGVETLDLRVARMTASALKIAHFLSEHPSVEWVNYPGLPGNKYYALGQKYFPLGAGAIFAFGVKGGQAAAFKCINRLKIFSLLVNVADAKSLVIHPGTTTHAQLTEKERLAAGVTREAIRISIGIEDVNDLIADLDQALNSASSID